MKIIYSLLLFLFVAIESFAQNNVGIGTASPAASAALDVSSTSKGMLVPRMNSSQRGLISSPATGLLVFDTDTESFWIKNTSGWTELVDNGNNGFKKSGTSLYTSGNTQVGIGTPIDCMEETEKILSVLIIDDEERASDVLRLMLQKFVSQVSAVAVCTDARQAASLITSLRPGLLFLDIKMPHLSGFEVLQQIPNPSFKVIFTTAFNEFAIKAIRFSAFDYLLKPVDVEELMATFDRYLSEHKGPPSDGRLMQNMLHNMQPASEHFRLAIPSKEGVYFLAPSTVMYCEAVNNYTRFHTAEGKQFLISKTLGEYEDMLTPYHFIRSHKSFLVNKDFVACIDHDGLLVLRNGVRVEVSKRRKAGVMRLMKA